MFGDRRAAATAAEAFASRTGRVEQGIERPGPIAMGAGGGAIAKEALASEVVVTGNADARLKVESLEFDGAVVRGRLTRMPCLALDGGCVVVGQ
jgi:hypothetical protein